MYYVHYTQFSTKVSTLVSILPYAWLVVAISQLAWPHLLALRGTVPLDVTVTVHVTVGNYQYLFEGAGDLYT